MESKPLFLLVEDNILNQKVATFNFKNMDCQVITVNNGLEALKAFKNNYFDVILMDIMMPIMDGFQCVKKIREFEDEEGRENKVIIIALTANTLDNDKEKCISYGMNNFMEKPLNIQKLKEILEEFDIYI